MPCKAAVWGAPIVPLSLLNKQATLGNMRRLQQYSPIHAHKMSSSCRAPPQINFALHGTSAQSYQVGAWHTQEPYSTSTGLQPTHSAFTLPP